MEEDEAGNNSKEEEEPGLSDEVLRMSTDELISRTRLLDNEVRTMLIFSLCSPKLQHKLFLPKGEDNAVRGDADPA